MTCKCGGDTKVTDSVMYQGQVFRKRKCVECGEIFAIREYEVSKKHPVVVAAFKAKTDKYRTSQINLEHPDEYDAKGKVAIIVR